MYKKRIRMFTSVAGMSSLYLLQHKVSSIHEIFTVNWTPADHWLQGNAADSLERSNRTRLVAALLQACRPGFHKNPAKSVFDLSRGLEV